MNPLREHELLLTRRQFFGRGAVGLGSAALGSLLNPKLLAAEAESGLSSYPRARPHLHSVFLPPTGRQLRGS